jgi:phosphatidylglycerophosphatase A
MQSITVKVAYVVATFFGAGRAPKAPGTVGSLAALPFAYCLWRLPVGCAWTIVVATFLVGVWAAHVVIRAEGVEDSQKIVIDEVVGIFISTSLCGTSLAGFGAAFFLFSLFDILKPEPIRYADRKNKCGFGGLLDDALAGGLALLVFYIFARFMTL